MSRVQISLRDRSLPQHWRNLGEYWNISAGAKERMEWMIFYHTVGNKNATQTATYFGITPKTFYKWKKRFDPKKIQSLEEESRTPKNQRVWEVTPIEEERIKHLRILHMRWGKKKLQVLYQQEYHEYISTWKIECVVRKNHLYPDPHAHRKLVRRRQHQRKRVRIHTLDTASYEPGKLWHVDTVLVDWYGSRRSILTAIEDKTKLAYARVYQTHSSRSAADFLKRLVYLSDGDIAIVHSDNGSEFAGEFEKATQDLSLFQVYSRVRTPNDNPSLERFNRTIQEEWLDLTEVGLDDIGEANHNLTDWLVEYNSVRPHQTLDYQTPIAYAHDHYFQVLPMYPANTINCG